ncbi:unnamed protein product [Ilex paraguariensis]|uniref:Protein root UVB sensitive/RUS domain-containing protein n=1 Tax=Ilex paraguariensis TaxID=185542 RepID=A0ABC8R823_9AQUA
MQSTLYVASNSLPHPHLPWKPQKPRILTLQTLKLSLKPLTLSNSLKTLFGSEFEDEKLDKQDQPTILLRLPVVVRNSGSVSRYLWDGDDLKLVSVDGSARFSLSPFSLDFEDGFRKLVRGCVSGIRNFFLPREVSENYLEYVKWKFLHRVFSSALQVLATQAMFRAIGIGYSRSLASAAALNWVLKDGLGRLSRCIYTASLASAFDTNLKRVRFSTSVLFSLGIGVELLTPAFPQYFLLLASVANIAKQISLACYLATGTAVHRSFAIADNLGEVSAKAQDRLEIIMNIWIQLGYVPSPAEVSKEEGIDFLRSKGRELWPIRIGCPNPRGQIARLSMMTMRSLSDEDFYFICIENFCQGLSRSGQQGILLCMREGAGTSDVIMGLLQVCYVRKGLLYNRRDNILEACDNPDFVFRDWFKLIEDSKRSARNDFNLINEQMLGLGWACKHILLNTQEQARYSFVDD